MYRVRLLDVFRYHSSDSPVISRYESSWWLKCKL